MPRVTEVEPVGRFRLLVRFDDGVQGEIDIRESVTLNGVFEPLREQEFFRSVRVDREAGTICWPNGADLDPLVLHSRITGRPITFDDDGVKS